MVRPAVDRVALDHYLACRFVPSPRTLFEGGVSKLPPASTLVVPSEGRPRIVSWRVAPGSAFAGGSDDELAGQLAERYSDAVERQMMSDVPYGAFLSGGVDSAAVVAAMAVRATEPPTTFTIGFPGHGDVSTSADRRPGARLIGASHHSTTMGAGLPRRARGRCPGSGLRHRARRRCSAVALRRRAGEGHARPGQGADEPHGGYGRRRPQVLLVGLQLGTVGVRRPPPRSPGRSHAARARRVAHLLLGGRGQAERLTRLMEITDAPCASPCSARAAASRPPSSASPARDVLADIPGRGLLEQALYLDTRMFLPDETCCSATRCRWRPGLELRVPFLDLELMRFVERIPASARAPAPASACTARRWRGSAARDRRPAQTRLRHPVRRLFPGRRWARRVERRYAPAGALSELVDPGAVGRLVAGTAPAAPTTRASCSACSSSRSGTAPSWRRGAIAGVTKRILFVHNSNASFRPDRPGDPRRALRDRGPPPAERCPIRCA